MSDSWTAPPPDRTRWSLTRAQLRATALIVLAGGTLVVSLALRSQATIGDPMPGHGRLARLLGTRLDPNTAPQSELEALPGLGPSKAAAIVAFRDQWQASGQSGPAFATPASLEQVRGIGPSMVERMKSHLRFPADALPGEPRP